MKPACHPGIFIILGAILCAFAHESSGTRNAVPGSGNVLVQHQDGSNSTYECAGKSPLECGRLLLAAAANSRADETIAIGAGLYELPSSLVTKPRQTVVGAGVNQTTLRWAPLTSQPSSAAGAQLVGNNYYTQTDGVTVRAMTIDCNAQKHAPGIGAEGVILNGSNCVIEDIKVINPGRTDGMECFPIAIYSGNSTVKKVHAHIRRVEVTRPAMIFWQSGLSCILIGGTYYDSSIEECYVHDMDVGDSSGRVLEKPRYVHAFGMSGSEAGAPPCKRGRVARNRAVNLTGVAGAQGAAIYTDTGSVEGYDILDNELINVVRGIHLHEGDSYEGVRIVGNKIRFLADMSSSGGIMISGQKIGDCLIADNDVGQQGAYVATGSYAIAVGRARHLTLRNNFLRMKSKAVEISLGSAKKQTLLENNRRLDGSFIRFKD